MFNFWYSEKCTRQIKLIICIATCVLVLIAAEFSKLSLVLTIICIVCGISLHLIRTLSERIQPDHPYYRGFQILFFTTQILIFFGLLDTLEYQNLKELIALATQVIGFVAIGLFVISIKTKNN